MKTTKAIMRFLIAVIYVLVVAVMAGGCQLLPTANEKETTAATEPPTEAPTEAPTTEVTEPPHNWQTGLIASLRPEAEYYDETGVLLGTLPRGAQVEYEMTPEGKTALLLEDEIVYLQEGAYIVSDPADTVPAHTQYVRTAVNLRDMDGKLLSAFADKGTAVEITGCDYLAENGQPHMYRVSFDGEEGYMMPWYLVDSEEAALANYDEGDYAVHEGRGNRYGGGGAADLDYYPRQKGPIEGNTMPEECRALYIVAWRVAEVDAYIEIAKDSGIAIC